MLPLLLGISGPTLSPEEKEQLTQWQPAGYILFSRNIISAKQTRELTDELRKISHHTPLIGIDQEGGRVIRTKSLGIELPSASWLAQNANLKTISQHASITARCLDLLGFNLNFAPVLDISSHQIGENALGGRYFGSTPAEVSHFAGKWLKTLQQEQILGCAKHFPGLGRATVDSHFDLPLIEQTRHELLTFDLLPYIDLAPKLQLIMVAHMMIPKIDSEFPSSLSPKIVTELLRHQLGFEKLICTDDLDMLAIANKFSPSEAVCQALRAGVDLPMICHQFEHLEEIGNAIQNLPEEIVRTANARINDACWKLPLPCDFSSEAWDELVSRTENLFPKQNDNTTNTSPVTRY